MRRREFLCGALLLQLPSSAWSQQRDGMKRLGILLSSQPNDESNGRLLALYRALRSLGWESEKNLLIDLHWGNTNVEDTDREAQKLLMAQPDVILANSGSTVIPLERLTPTIPIVFTQVADPIGAGVVDNLSKPGGNATGFANFDIEICTKWLSILRDILPDLRQINVLHYINSRSSDRFIQELRHVSGPLQISVASNPIAKEEGLRKTISDLSGGQNLALIILPDPATTGLSRQIVDAIQLARLPAIFPAPGFARAGGLVAYGDDPRENFAQAAIYIDKILRGAKASELPVQMPRKISLTINLKSARDLGLSISPGLLASADEVIE